MRIPEIQAELKDIADRVAKLSAALSRRPAKRKAPATSKKVTPLVKAAIQMTALANPQMSQQAIATKHGVNTGRVSEILRGKRK